MTSLQPLVVAREAQYNYLKDLLSKSITLPSSVLVWGPNSSGKSTVVEQVIQDMGIEHVAVVNAREVVCGQRQFLITIIQQLFECEKNPSVLDGNLNCESTAAFVIDLCVLKIEANVKSKPFVVVLEETETLRAEHGDMIEVLSRLQDMVQFNICVIFISCLPYSSYSSLLDLKPMVIINFPQYTKDEITAILIQEAPQNSNLELYTFHVKMTLSIFYMACRDVRKLQRLALLNYERFVAPIAGQDVSISQKKMRELWKAVQPQLAKDFKTLKANMVPAQERENHGSNSRPMESKYKNIYQLPNYVKFLLLASYLATHNPSTSDRRFFVKSQLGRKRRKVEGQLTEKSHEPQSFSQPRLVAIYGFLTDYIAPKDQLILSQLTHLCQLQLLERVDNSTTPLEEPKYKCVASLEFIDEVARSVDFDVKKYLYHFV